MGRKLFCDGGVGGAFAKIEPGHKIVLRYYGKHGLVEMTYERRVAEMGKTALS